MIKFSLVPLDETCVFQILEMDEDQRHTDTEGHWRDYYASNDVIVRSNAYCPWLHYSPEPAAMYDSGPGIVCLRGALTSFDNRAFLLRFPSNTERDKFMERVREALREWAQNGGFTNKPAEYEAKPTPSEPFTYHF